MRINIKQFNAWKSENVSMNADGSYSTQCAQYRNRLVGLDALKKYYYNEFIKN